MTAATGRLTFRAEQVARCWDELLPLLEAHYREIALYQDIPLCPDRARYEALDQTGHARLYTAREAGGRLVGYIGFVVTTHPHYATSLVAHQDVVYLDPVYRGHRDGIGLIAWADEQLRAEGVQVVYQHVKVGFDWSPALLALGYQESDRLFCRRLDIDG